MERHAPTLEEVAAHAGVSRSTVSRVVNGATKVAPSTVALVQDAVSALGYVPNHAARSLASRRTGSIALVIPETDEWFLTDPFFAATLRGMNAELSDEDVQLVLLIAQRDSPAARVGNYLRGGHVDGAIVVSHHSGDGLENVLVEARVPTIFVGRPYHELPALSFVDVDNVAGGRLATEHLLDGGAAVVATIAGPADMVAAVDRTRGWREALADAGREPGPYAQADYTAAGGQEAMQRLLAHEPRPDAVFVASDQMAVGAIAAIAAAGLRIPDDIAICGFDDLGIPATTTPRLTTVRNPVIELSRIATRLILDRVNKLAGGQWRSDGGAQVILDPILVPGSSS